LLHSEELLRGHSFLSLLASFHADRIYLSIIPKLLLGFFEKKIILCIIKKSLDPDSSNLGFLHMECNVTWICSMIDAIQAEAFNPKTLFLIGTYTIGR
jgi:hypothetical protein